MIAQFFRDVKAYWNGQRRVGKRGERGRVYVSREPGDGGGSQAVPHKAAMVLKARVIRADGSPDEVHTFEIQEN